MHPGDLNEASDENVSRVFSGAPWESQVGYCRAIRRDNFIAVSGTTSFKDGEIFAPGETYAQTQRCLEIIVESLEKLGASSKNIKDRKNSLTKTFLEPREFMLTYGEGRVEDETMVGFYDIINFI